MQGNLQRSIARMLFNVALFALFIFAGFSLGPYARSAYDRTFPGPEYETGDYSALFQDAGKSVVMFSTSTCPHCEHARELLQKEHVDYKDLIVDQSSEARRQFEALGGEAVPLLYIGNRRITGFRENIIHESLSLVPR